LAGTAARTWAGAGGEEAGAKGVAGRQARKAVEGQRGARVGKECERHRHHDDAARPGSVQRCASWAFRGDSDREGRRSTVTLSDQVMSLDHAGKWE
jgi:hypothetical protein